MFNCIEHTLILNNIFEALPFELLRMNDKYYKKSNLTFILVRKLQK